MSKKSWVSCRTVFKVLFLVVFIFWKKENISTTRVKVAKNLWVNKKMNYFPGLLMSSYLPLHRLSEHRPLVGVKKWENRRVRPQRSVFAQFKMYEKTDITLVSVKSICGCNHQVVSFTTREEKDLLCVACSEIKPQISSNSHICETSSQRMFAWPSVHTHTHRRAQVTHKTAEQPVEKTFTGESGTYFFPEKKQ